MPYLLLTPGPLTTSRSVREAMLADYSTWDADYNRIVTRVRDGIVKLATQRDGYTSTLMQGSGTFPSRRRWAQPSRPTAKCSS